MRAFAIPLILLAAACQKAPSGQAPVTEAEAAKIAEAAEATFTKGDAKAIMDQYANGAVMFSADTPALSTDRGVQEGWAKTFISMQPADYHVTDRQIQLLGPDAFVSSGMEVFTVASGNARPTVSARFTDVFKRSKDGKWRIVNEHVSMPPTPAGQPQ